MSETIANLPEFNSGIGSILEDFVTEKLMLGYTRLVLTPCAIHEQCIFMNHMCLFRSSENFWAMWTLGRPIFMHVQTSR